MKMDGMYPSETLLHTSKATRHQSAGDQDRHIYHRENLKSHIKVLETRIDTFTGARTSDLTYKSIFYAILMMHDERKI
jgi:hypothetical protein